MSRTRIAVLVSGGGTNLQALIDANLKYGEIALVLSSNPEAYALKRAEQAGIPAAVVSRKDCHTAAEFEEKLLKKLREQGAELIVLAGFLCILSKGFVAAYPDRIVNIHPSLIPSFCGAGYYGLKVHEAALAWGVKVTGATVHLVNEVPDGGRILLQKAVEVQEGDTPITLQKRVMEQAEWVILPQAVDMLAEQIAKGKQK
ncbi:MAG: phosphoribosylglycinamide formyltransferase [Christensenellales bacterium]